MSTPVSKDNLEWGDKDSASADKNSSKLNKNDSNEKHNSSPVDDNTVDLSEDEPGRNRKGVKEGESSIGKDKI